MCLDVIVAYRKSFPKNTAFFQSCAGNGSEYVRMNTLMKLTITGPNL